MTKELREWGKCAKKKPRTNNKSTRSKAKKLGLYVYQCPVCSHYHFTKSKQPKRREDKS